MKRRIAALLVIVMVGLFGPLSPAAATSWDFYSNTHSSADLFWGFNQGSGDAHDYSENGNEGTVSATDPQPGQPGIDAHLGNYALRFNGAGTVTSPEVFSESNTFTQMAWIKTTSTTGGFIMGITASSGRHDRMIWMSNAGHVHAGVYGCSPTCFQKLKSPSTYNDGN